ncbi:MAG: aminotransferase class III-fold pyridoxal phosphate-dependent enzyme, partial [Elusimicrobiota bacterium]
MRLHVITLGCQMSVADGGEMAQPLLSRGFRSVASPEDADAIVVNTCTVRQHAEDKALSLIGRLKTWKDADRERVLIVAGCAAERLGGWLSTRFPHVDLVVGAKSIADYPRIVAPPPGPKGARIVAQDKAYSSTSYIKVYPLVVDHGKGAMVEDVDGNRYVDFMAGIAVSSTGHAHPEVVKAVQDAAAKFLHICGTDFYYQ